MLSVGHRPSLVPFHEVVVQLLNGRRWRLEDDARRSKPVVR